MDRRLRSQAVPAVRPGAVPNLRHFDTTAHTAMSLNSFEYFFFSINNPLLLGSVSGPTFGGHSPVGVYILLPTISSRLLFC